MRLNKVAAALGVIAAVGSGAGYANSDSAVINFNGTITASPCTIDVGSQGQSVTLPSVSDMELGRLAAEGVLADLPNQTVNFLIKGCGSGVSGASVTFLGNQDSSTGP